ncbi:MAG: hypothetical protein GXP55_17300 [Deltaproteobacteria bacterium]|nr:hypothetical protein [Deltaproteobacteria bacterium]
MSLKDGELHIEGNVLALSEILGVAEHGAPRRRRLVVLTSREPPAPPWFELTPSMLEPSVEIPDLETLARTLRSRLESQSYRRGRLARVRLERDELETAVLAREELPGALSVPVGRGPRDPVSRVAEPLSAMSGGTTVAVLSFSLAWPHAPPGAIIASGAVGALVATGVMYLVARRGRRRRQRTRVLVLCPDGCVIGLPSGVRTFHWSELGPFSISVDRHGRFRRRRGLRVVDPDGELLGTLDASWFAQNLTLIVAVANAYRERVGS